MKNALPAAASCQSTACEALVGCAQLSSPACQPHCASLNQGLSERDFMILPFYWNASPPQRGLDLGADIKGASQKHRNEQLNRSTQNLFFAAVAESNETAARKALAVVVELWRRQVWTDAHAVSIIGMIYSMPQIISKLDQADHFEVHAITYLPLIALLSQDRQWSLFHHLPAMDPWTVCAPADWQGGLAQC